MPSASPAPRLANSDLARECLIRQGYEVPDRPRLPSDPAVRALWPRLLDEEVGELRDALEADDLLEVADAVADVLYVAYQAAASFGLPIDEVFREVHRSNLTKVPADGAPPVRRADGKTLKPMGYEPPDLHAILSRD